MPENHKFQKITIDKLSRMMSEDDDFILIDTMTEARFNKVHIPGSRQACVFEVSFTEQIENITADKNSFLVLYGADSGTMDALSAAVKLDNAGYKNLLILEGGIAAWRSQGLPVEGSQPEESGNEEIDLMFTDGRYVIDCNTSTIGWTGRNPNSSHYGNVSIASGEMRVHDGKLSGEFEIDMTSISNINLSGDELQPVLIDHLKSDDFFHTSFFPTAKFEIHTIIPLEVQNLSSPNFQIDGILEMHGIQKDLSFPATFLRTEDDTMSFEAHFDLDRTRWNIIYGSAKYFKHLGMHLVFDNISIELRIATIKG